MKNDDKFYYFIPVDFSKGEKDKKTGEELIKIKGVISTPDEDSDGEILDPEGFDLSRFISSGQINYNHQSKTDPSSIVGHPTVAKVIDGNKVYMEGVLYPELQKTKDIVKLAETLSKYGNGRQLGFSIEGKALERSPLNSKRITKALITGCAITACPKNTSTTMSLIKGELNDYFSEEIEKSEANGGEQHIIDVTNPETGMRYIVKKDFSIIVEKAISTTSSASALKKESLDGSVKNLASSEDIKKAIITIARAKEQGMVGEGLQEIIKDTLEKGGEGSKGGKIIGHTMSGKPIYDTFNHPSHKDFNRQDHGDAINIHQTIGYKASKNKSIKHYEQADLHKEAIYNS